MTTRLGLPTIESGGVGTGAGQTRAVGAGVLGLGTDEQDVADAASASSANDRALRCTPVIVSGPPWDPANMPVAEPENLHLDMPRALDELLRF